MESARKFSTLRSCLSRLALKDRMKTQRALLRWENALLSARLEQYENVLQKVAQEVYILKSREEDNENRMRELKRDFLQLKSVSASQVLGTEGSPGESCDNPSDEPVI